LPHSTPYDTGPHPTSLNAASHSSPHGAKDSPLYTATAQETPPDTLGAQEVPHFALSTEAARHTLGTLFVYTIIEFHTIRRARLCISEILGANSKFQFQFVSRDIEESEFLDLVDFGDVGLSVETVIHTSGIPNVCRATHI